MTVDWNQRKSAVEAFAFTGMMALALGYGFLRRHAGAVAGEVLPKSLSERTTRLYESSRAPIPFPKSLDRHCRSAWETIRGLDLAEFVEYPPRAPTSFRAR